MFGIGIGELFIIILIAVLVLGPKRCMSVFIEAKKILKKIETEWNSTKDILN